MTDSSETSSDVHLSQFSRALVEVRAAVDVLFDALAYAEAGEDEKRYRAFKEALHERHEQATQERLQDIADSMDAAPEEDGEGVPFRASRSAESSSESSAS